MGRKPAAKSACAKAKTSVAQSGSKEVQWARAQITTLQSQREAAVNRGDTWLEEPHQWHEDQLLSVLEYLEKDPAAFPTEFQQLRDDVEFYVSQFADDSDTSEDTFYDDREIYQSLLQKCKPADNSEEPYTRPPETEETEAAMELVNRMADASRHGISKLARELQTHSTSAGVQLAGLKRISSLVDESKGKEKDSAHYGVQPKGIVPLVGETMQRFPRDPEVICVAVATLQNIAMVDGAAVAVLENGAASFVVEALKKHLPDKEVATAVTKFVKFLITQIKVKTNEWTILVDAGTEKVLERVLQYHPLDAYINSMVKTSLPFLR